MAKPRTAVPRAATNREPERPEEGEAALRAVLEEYGGEYADALEYTDELEDVLTTTILFLASADDDDIKHVTDSLTALVAAGDGVSTEGTIALAERVGENGDDLAAALDLVLELQREDDLEDLIDLAKTASALELDADAVRALNRLLGVVSGVERTLRSVGRLADRGAEGVRAGLRSLAGASRTGR